MEIGKLAAALCQAQGEVDGVQKQGWNDHQKFNYTSIEGMVAATRGPLRRAELVVLPTAHRVEGEVLVTEWVIAHSSGESMPLRYDMPIVPGKGRPMDKAASASASQALNYLLRDLLLLPRGEREDIDSRDDSGFDPQAVDFPAVLKSHGLTVAQWDAWAWEHSRTKAGALTPEQARGAAQWLDGEGSAVVSGWCQAQGVG